MAMIPTGRPMTIAVPHGRGGSTDTAVRILTRNAQTHLGQPVTILNLAGINGSFALDLMVDSIKAPPDGYSLSTANSSVILSPLVGQTKYRYIDEIRPLGMYAEEAFLLAVPADSPWQTLADFISDAKKKPGAVRAGNSGVGNVSHVLMEWLSYLAGFEPEIVTVDSGKDLCDRLCAGIVDCCISNRADMRVPLAEGKVRILAAADDTRGEYPNRPTFREQGYDIVAHLRQSIGVSRAAPEGMYRLLCEASDRMAHEKDTDSLIKEAGLRFLYRNAEEYEALWQTENARWQALMDGGAGSFIRAQIKKLRGN